MGRKTKPERKSWVVRMRCEVTKEVVVDDCTEEQARANPWEYVISDELEIDQHDWKVLSVEPND